MLCQSRYVRGPLCQDGWHGGWFRQGKDLGGLGQLASPVSPFRAGERGREPWTGSFPEPACGCLPRRLRAFGKFDFFVTCLPLSHWGAALGNLPLANRVGAPRRQGGFG